MQRLCYTDFVPVEDTCTLQTLITLPVTNSAGRVRFLYAATAHRYPNVSVQLWPDCRFLIRNNYASQSIQVPLKPTGANVTCYLPQNIEKGSPEVFDGVYNFEVFQRSVFFPSISAY